MNTVALPTAASEYFSPERERVEPPNTKGPTEIPQTREEGEQHACATRLSAEIFVIPLEPGKFIIYAPLRRTAFVANSRFVNLLQKLRSGNPASNSRSDVATLDFLKQLQIIDAGTERLPITEFSGDPCPTAVTLFLTTACNLRCTYCYASAGDTPVRIMSLEVAKRGIDFVSANAAKRGVPVFEIAYHGGGEPTVNWKTLTGSFEHAQARARASDLKVIASTATNGALTDSQIDWVIEHLAGASVSFDGLPVCHDRHRPLASGGGSSSQVIHTLRRFDEAAFPYGIRMTVTADQIPHMADSVEFICANFRPKRIQVEPAYQMGRWAGAPSAESEAFIEGYRSAQARAHEHGQSISFSAARIGTLTNHFCGITQDTFALSPDGNVSACYEVFSEQNAWSKVFFYGQPDGSTGGYEFDTQKLSHLRRQAVQHREYCRGCFAKWTCAGDCYHKSLTVNGATEFSGSDRCAITRELTKDQILEKIAQAGGIYWHEPFGKESNQPAGKELLL